MTGMWEKSAVDRYWMIFSLIIVASLCSRTSNAQSKAKNAQPGGTPNDAQICKAIKADRNRYQIQRGYPLDGCDLLDMESATGDGAQTILVDVGGVGASTDLVVVYRWERGILSAANFEDRKGRVWKGGMFLQGASVMHSADVTLSASEQALFTQKLNGTEDDGTYESCEVHAYQWIAGHKRYVERTSKAKDKVRCDH